MDSHKRIRVKRNIDARLNSHFLQLSSFQHVRVEELKSVAVQISVKTKEVVRNVIDTKYKSRCCSNNGCADDDVTQTESVHV